MTRLREPFGGAGMRSVRHTDTLVHCDGVQVFEGRDPAGGRYVGVMVDGGDGSDRYLVTGVASERLRRFRSGALDFAEPAPMPPPSRPRSRRATGSTPDRRAAARRTWGAGRPTA